MWVACLLSALFYVTGQCHNLLPHLNDDQKMIQCVIDILDKYFTEGKELTYVNMNPADQELLRMIHSTMHFSLISRNSTQQMRVQNQGYLVFSPDVHTFTEHFEVLTREPLWNPHARFLFVIKLLSAIELRKLFDVLLRHHVNNALVMNGTDDGHLYTYNPFDNYACGRYYDTVINYGLCSQATHDLYPNKLINGLRNCTFRALFTHRPPFAIDPTKNEYRNKLTGMEQHILKIVSESDEFKIHYFDFDYLANFTANITPVGAMEMLQKNKTDILFGGMMMLATRAEVFSYLFGYHDYVDELRFAVKKASFLPNWKYFYLEFDTFVWVLLLISFILYCAIMIYLLRGKDKGEIILELLDNLLLHGRKIRCPMIIKCVLLMWVWYAYLVNTFYQSSLVSLTTNPSKEHQISNEKDMVKYNVRPCIGTVLANFIYTEPSKRLEYNRTKVNNMACDDIIEAMQLVSNTKGIFTVIPSYFYLYNKQTFYDKWGDPLIYYFERPFAKILLGYYFYRGFPISSRFRLNMMRMRESGIANKNLQDQYFMRTIKFRFSQKEFEFRFVFPWCVYVSGCLIAIICFFAELTNKYLKWY